MGLTNLPEYISAIVAIIALLISCYQARLSNKQSLFKSLREFVWVVPTPRAPAGPASGPST